MNKKISVFNNEFINPVIPASGTFGFGYEFSDLYDLNILGSISLKGTTQDARYGNPLPRIAEGRCGIINAIGLQNPGVDKVIKEEIPKLKQVYNGKVLANVGGHSKEEYINVCMAFDSVPEVWGIELNISCPNVKGGGMAFGQDPDIAYDLIKSIRPHVKKPLIVKLSPNVTDITVMAKACEKAGCDGFSLINTLVGMRIDLKRQKPIISVKKGGYSGPAIFPIALKMVYDVYEVTKLPIIGIGGISSANDVIEMMLAGASLVEIGAYNLVNPYACKEIITDLDRVMKELNISDLRNIIGKAH